ncbi:hypothetical protein [Halostella litorea]|uniref:hypothetical protein n=1 Tax=Halostella litorea TaxID=2528831 RepID=UPI0010919DEC|nr:hypothetical protein [Halostella litorea]
MADTTFETVDTMLESVQSDVDDPELCFKLRTARQLLVFLEERYAVGREALEDADFDDETLDSLRQLGYLE